MIGGLKGFSPLEPLNDLYRYAPEKDEWKQLTDLPLKGYAWVAQPVNEKHLLVTGRADGMVHDGIWIIDPGQFFHERSWPFDYSFGNCSFDKSE